MCVYVHVYVCDVFIDSQPTLKVVLLCVVTNTVLARGQFVVVATSLGDEYSSTVIFIRVALNVGIRHFDSQ